MHEALQGLVKCFWSLDAPATDQMQRQRIVPDGCMELIIHHGDVYLQYLDDHQHITQPRGFVFGQITTPLEIAPTGKTGIIAARFFPNGFNALTQMSLHEMENKAVSLEILFGQEGLDLEKQVMQASNNTERIIHIEAFLLGRLKTPEVSQRITQRGVEILLQSKGLVDLHQLSDQLQIHRRQLERNFSRIVGMSPKQLSKIIRLQSAIQSMSHQTFSNLTTLALDHGYYDQAHFIKDFKELTGINPKKFYVENLRLSALFIGQ